MKVLASFFKVLLLCAVLGCLGGCAGDGAGREGLVPKEDGWPASLVNVSNTWRGGFLGGALCEPFMAGIGEVAGRAGAEAARSGKPVVYLTIDDFQRVEVFPLGEETQPNCRSLRQRLYQSGSLVREKIVEVCL